MITCERIAKSLLINPTMLVLDQGPILSVPERNKLMHLCLRSFLPACGNVIYHLPFIYQTRSQLENVPFDTDYDDE